MPFQEVWLPDVAAARARLPATAVPLDGLERWLLRRLAFAGSAVLQRDLAAETAWLPPGDHEREFSARVDRRLLLADHPILASLAEQVATDWVEAVREFLERLEGYRPGAAVECVEGGLSDPHHGGRTVLRVRFAGGETLFYKPRSLALDAWFQGRLPLVGLRPLRVEDRGDHGWMEEAPHRPRPSARLFRRFGALAALVHALGGVDCHAGNLRLDGEHPHLVDLETLLQPAVRLDLESDRMLVESIVRTGFLTALEPGEHLVDLLAGFREASSLLPADLLAGADGLHTRFLFRQTATYGDVLERSLQPEALRDPAARQRELDLLARAVGDVPQRAALLGAEQEALRRLDLPRFTVPVTARGNLFERSGMEFSRRQLERPDLDLQERLARLYLAPEAPPTPAADFLAVAEVLEARALVSRDGDAHWVEPRDGRLQSLADGLYGGSAGVALFLAAAARLSGRAKLADLARMALRPLERQRPAPLARWLRPGALGLLLYALTRCSDELGDPRWLNRALALAREVPPGGVADVLDGSAGVVLGLLALHERLPEPWLLERAVEEGGRLAGRPGVLGMAHGSTGVALALHRLAGASGREEFERGAGDLVAWEDSLFDPASGRWPDLREGAVGPRANWCSGSAGIVLARLSMGARVPEEAARGLQEDLPVDSCCCGNAGRLEALRALGRPAAFADRPLRIERSRVGDHAGFFRGLAGVGYALLRFRFPDLPSVLAWEVSNSPRARGA